MILPFTVKKFLLDLNLQLRKKERQRALVSCSENFKNKHVATAVSSSLLLHALLNLGP